MVSAAEEPSGRSWRGRTAAGEPRPSCRPRPPPRKAAKQKAAYDASAQRLEDLVRAQNPGVGKQPPVTFEHLVQQFYVSAISRWARARRKASGRAWTSWARATPLTCSAVLAEKTRGNLTEAEDRMLQSVLFEVRMAFLELTSMITHAECARLRRLRPPGKH